MVLAAWSAMLMRTATPKRRGSGKEPMSVSRSRNVWVVGVTETASVGKRYITISTTRLALYREGYHRSDA